ncbi:MAG: flagellar basal body P-ring formation protein FlgA [Bryobacteraceae bacterium]|nr:flagellar basal body P-ring formation protein FlgA [Bryobacteraceae bacterium]
MIAATLLLAIAASTPCLQPSGSKITAADVAASSPLFAQLPADLVIGFAPQPGFTRLLMPAELMQWLSRHKVTGEIREPVCFSWQLATPNPEAIRTAMLASLPEGSDLSVVDTSQYGVPRGEMVFPVKGLQSRTGNGPVLWKGYVRYADSAQADVWARVELRVPYKRVVAVEEIRAGLVIEPSMLRVEERAGAPLPRDTATELDQVAGRIARRTVLPGNPFALSALEKAPAIRKGDSIHVNIISGATRLGFDGIAEAAGAEGESVQIKMNDTGKVVRARVLSTGSALLDLNDGIRK